MQIQFQTNVNKNKDQVKNLFTEDLFLKLTPPFMKFKLLEFGGCKKGDKVSIQLLSPFMKGSWVSEITYDQDSEEEWIFIDQGISLPKPLVAWEHQHIVKAINGKSQIIDKIDYKCANRAIELIILPGLALSFLYRSLVYKKSFI